MCLTSSCHNKRILILSDTHAPYNHKDLLKFLNKVKKKFKPTRVIHIGDEVDYHGISFHKTDPDLMSAGNELKASIKFCQKLEKIFPDMDLVHSNHGSLAYRRAKVDGIPRYLLKDYNDVLGVSDGWKWHEEILLKSGSNTIMFRHQFSANVLKSAEQLGCSCVQGHYHSKFEISYTSSPRCLNWGMTVGCLIDAKSLAFEYNKTQVKRPILGIGVIEDGKPRLIPMVLDNKGNWDGTI